MGDLLAAAAAHADAGPGHMFAARQLLRIAARCTVRGACGLGSAVPAVRPPLIGRAPLQKAVREPTLPAVALHSLAAESGHGALVCACMRMLRMPTQHT